MEMLTVESSLFEERKKQISAFENLVMEQHALLHSGKMEMAGWVDWPNGADAAQSLLEIKKEAAKVQAIATVMVVIGIGGSFLGAKACCDFLKYETRQNGIKVVFAGWNLSDSYHAALLNDLENEEVVVCVISKSGATMETAAAFDLFKDFLKKKYGSDYTHRIYAITSKNQGSLCREAQEKGYGVFDIEENIGGRYSVLTAVGLFPLAVCGFDVDKIMDGAKQAYTNLNTGILGDNFCYQYAVLRKLLFDEGRCIEAFSVMSPHLYVFSEWLKQLFGESEGKKGRGILPFSVRYSTDLHSLGQFFQEGNPICFESIITPEYNKGELPPVYEGKTMRELNSVVCDAVYEVRQQNNTPVFRFSLHHPPEAACGYALYFFEKACAMCCLIQGIDPFDQPGVEVYKKEIKELLKKTTL